MTDIEKVRLKIGTVISATFTDAQIQAFLDMADDSINLAAAMAIESWAASAISDMDSEKIGDYQYSQKRIDKALALAEKLKDSEAEIPALDIASMDLTAGSGITAEED